MENFRGKCSDRLVPSTPGKQSLKKCSDNCSKMNSVAQCWLLSSSSFLGTQVSFTWSATLRNLQSRDWMILSIRQAKLTSAVFGETFCIDACRTIVWERQWNLFEQKMVIRNTAFSLQFHFVKLLLHLTSAPPPKINCQYTGRHGQVEMEIGRAICLDWLVPSTPAKQSLERCSGNCWKMNPVAHYWLLSSSSFLGTQVSFTWSATLPNLQSRDWMILSVWQAKLTSKLFG